VNELLEQEQEKQKRREQEQQKREQKLREQEQLKLRQASKRVRRSTKARPQAERKPSQERKDAEEEPPDKPLIFLSKQQVLDRIPVSGPTLWHWSRTGKFPSPRFIGSRTVWLESEVIAWMKSRPMRNYKTAGGA
jgi:predicted DNA-binding transcriptional regulator AlpA